MPDALSEIRGPNRHPVLTEQTATVLGLWLAVVTPTARLVANRTEWLWFDPAERLAIWRPARLSSVVAG